MANTPKQTRIAYRCPSCTDTVVGLIGRFAQAADFLRLRCPCDASHLDIRMRRDKKAELSVPCLFCKKNHTYTLSDTIVFDRERFTLSCPYASMDIAALGDEDAVGEELERMGRELSSLMRDLEAEKLSELQPQDMDDEEILPDPQVYDTVRFLVRELEAEGTIDCPCHIGTGYELRFAEGGIQVYCPTCGGTHLFRTDSAEASRELIELDSLTLR